MCLYFIGGVIKHAKALNAFTNPTTNSYKRLVPGYEAPVLLAYSARNRSASCRIPYGAGEKSKRVEFRFPDAMANPYLCYAALLMAGLDGIKNKIHPGEAMDKNLYDLPPAELAEVPTVCGSLREALESLAGRSRLPAQGRRVHQGPDRSLHRTEVARSACAGKPRRARSNSTCTTAPDRQRILANQKWGVRETGRPFWLLCERRALDPGPPLVRSAGTACPRVPLPQDEELC